MRLALFTLITAFLACGTPAFAIEPMFDTKPAAVSAPEAKELPAASIPENDYAKDNLVDLSIKNRGSIALPGGWSIVGQSSSSYPQANMRQRTESLVIAYPLHERMTVMVGLNRFEQSQQDRSKKESVASKPYPILGFTWQY